MIDRSVRSIAASIGKLSVRWTNPAYSYRKKAVRVLAERSGFDGKVSAALLDTLFKSLTQNKLLALLDAELGDHRVLDGFVKRPGSLRVHAKGPAVIAHVFASNVPGPAVLSFIHGLLVKGENIGKPSSKGAGFLDIYLESLRAFDPALASACRLLPATDRAGAMAAFKVADLVVAYGGNESLSAIREEIPVTTPFVGYGHRVSFEILFKEALKKSSVAALAKACAGDIWMMNQRGCLSPATFYVEGGGEVSPEEFAASLSKAIDRLSNGSKPRTFPRMETRHKLARLKKPSAKFLKSDFSAILLDEDPTLSLSEETGSVFVKPFRDIKKVYAALSKARPYLQAAAVEGRPDKRLEVAEALAALGVNRICRAGKMQEPPLLWHHDGRPNLASWVTWTDLET